MRYSLRSGLRARHRKLRLRTASIKRGGLPVVAAITALLTHSCSMDPGMNALPEAQPAGILKAVTLEVDDIIEPRYRRALGQTLAAPRAAPQKPDRVELVDCRAACDAVVPRQPMLTLLWQDPMKSPGPSAPSYHDEAQIRLDVAGTPNGFDVGRFSTIQLQNMQAIGDSTPLTSAMPRPEQGQVLLNNVFDGRIVPRPENLPLFQSNYTMMQSLQSLPPDIASAVQREMQSGSLNQVRVLGRSVELRGEAEIQAVTMIGLQPGLTYRFRMVEQAADGGEVLVEQICRVPVCPADYTKESR